MTADEKFVQYWNSTRMDGRNFYALKRAIIFAVLFIILKEISFATILNKGNYSFQVGYVAINLTAVFLIMFFYRRWEWNSNERRFKKLTGQ